MSVVRIILVVGTLIPFFSSWFIDDKDKLKDKKRRILIIIGTILGITYSVVSIITNWDVWTISKILILATICTAIWFLDGILDHNPGIEIQFIVFITVVSLIFSVVKYVKNFEIVSEIHTTTYTLISAEDKTDIHTEASGNILYFEAVVDTERKYVFWAMDENGDIEFYEEDMSDVKLNYLKEGEKPFYEETYKNKYLINHNKETSEKKKLSGTVQERKLHVPKSAIPTIIQFDLKD